MTPFYKNGNIWVIGSFDAFPAGTCKRLIYPGSNIIHVLTTDEPERLIVRGTYNQFCGANGVAYASLAAFKAATDGFFIKTLDVAGISADELAALDGAATPSALNVFATINDFPTVLAGVAAEVVVDADTFNLIKSVGGALKKITWANIKATLKTYFDTLYQGKFTVDQAGALAGAAAPTALNPFATIADIPADELTATQKAALLAIGAYYTPGITSGTTNAGGTLVSVLMSKAMTDPSANPADFTLKVGGVGVAINGVALNVDTVTIEITPTVPIVNGNVVTLDIAKGNVASAQGVLLEAVTAQAITNIVP